MNWKKQELEYLKTEFPSKKDSELSINLGKSENAIRIKASRLKLSKNSTTYRQNLVVSEIEQQVIIGSLMGDLHCRITHTGKNARIEGAQAIKQIEYAQFKLDLLERFGWKIYLRPEYIQFQSRSFPALNFYYDLFYYNNKKIVSRNILNKIDKLGLLIWYLDDGNYHKSDKNSRLYTNCFTQEEHKLMQEWFQEKWNISPNIHHYNNGVKEVYYLNFSAQETIKFHNLFQDFDIPETMRYKILQSHLPNSSLGSSSP